MTFKIKNRNKKTKKGGREANQPEPTLADIVNKLNEVEPEYLPIINGINVNPFIAPPEISEEEQEEQEARLRVIFQEMETIVQEQRRQEDDQQNRQGRMERINDNEIFSGIGDFSSEDYKNYCITIFTANTSGNIQDDSIDIHESIENIQNDDNFKKGLKYLNKILNLDNAIDADIKTNEFRKFRVFHNKIDDSNKERLKKGLIHDILKEYVIKTTQNLPIPVTNEMIDNLINHGNMGIGRSNTSGGGRKSKKNRMSKHKKSKKKKHLRKTLSKRVDKNRKRTKKYKKMR